MVYNTDYSGRPHATENGALVRVEGLCKTFAVTAGMFQRRRGFIHAVDDIDFEIHAGQSMGLVGESGSGKSVTGFSIVGLIDPPGRVASGSIRFKGEELVGAEEKSLRTIRGNRISMIFQDPTMTLNPVLRIDTQLVEAITAHNDTDKKTALAQARDALGQVGIPSPEERLKCYPHQLSGGMNQRIMIAQALASNPKLLIADEPTTNLDADTESEILDLIIDLQKEIGFSCLFITHNLGLVRRLCQRVYVMYKGEIVEVGSLDRIFNHPQHEHTQALVGAYLRLGTPSRCRM